MNIQEFKNEVKGNFFTVEFIKKNGEVRKMNARLGVKKYLKGGVLRYNPESRNNLIVFDIIKKDYRTLPLNRLISLSYKSKKVYFNNALLYYIK